MAMKSRFSMNRIFKFTVALQYFHYHFMEWSGNLQRDLLALLAWSAQSLKS